MYPSVFNVTSLRLGLEAPRMGDGQLQTEVHSCQEKLLENVPVRSSTH